MELRMFMQKEEIKSENCMGPAQVEETMVLQVMERMWVDMRKQQDRRTDKMRSSGQMVKSKAGSH